MITGNLYFKMIVIVIIYNILAHSAPICTNMPSTFDPSLFCSRVVNYPFYIADDTVDSIRTLNTLALSKLSTAMEDQKAQSCREALKKMICAEVYRPCMDNVDLGDINTYDTSSGTTLPYKRPCSSVCTHVQNSCPVLMGIGEGPTCDDIDAVSGVPIFDGNNSMSTCNALPNVNGIQLVHDSTEPYSGALCTGLIDTVFITGTNVHNTSLAPWLPPGEDQIILENKLVAPKLTRWPIVSSSSCQMAIRKYICGAFFTGHQVFNDTVLGPVTLPSFLHRDICTHYETECAGMIAFLKIPVNCDATAGPINLYPTETQVVSVFNGTKLGMGLRYLSTEPNRMTRANETFMPVQCPRGFTEVVNWDSTTMRLGMPGGSCAFRCPTWRVGEPVRITIIFLFTLLMITGGVGMVNLMVTPIKKRGNMFITFAFYHSFVFCLIRSMTLFSNMDMCEDVDSELDRFDLTLPTLTGWLERYTYSMVNNVVTGCIGLELFLRIFLGMRKIQIPLMVGFTVALLIELIFFLYGIITEPSMRQAGYDIGIVYPLFSAEYMHTLFKFKDLPVSIIIIGFIVLAFSRLIEMGLKAGRKSFFELVRTYSTLVVLGLGSLLYTCVIIYNIITYNPTFGLDVKNWAVCVMSQWNGTNQEAIDESCGDIPMLVTTIVSLYVGGVCLNAALLYSTFSANAIAFWSKLIWRNRSEKVSAMYASTASSYASKAEEEDARDEQEESKEEVV